MDSSAADDPMADEAGVEDAFTQEITDYSNVPRYHVLSWMETVEGMVAGVAPLPPMYLILNRGAIFFYISSSSCSPCVAGAGFNRSREEMLVDLL